MQGILDIHRSTLERIRITFFAGDPGAIPDFSRFGCLESLTLHYENLLKDTPEIAANKITAPVLDELTIEWTLLDGVKIWEYGKAEAD